jgi:chemotaxis protein CheD
MHDIHLHPCEVWFGGGRTRVHTVLGSCVAITLWHPTLHIGGMCHYMMCCRPIQPQGRPRQPDGCYADKAMDVIQAKIRASRRRSEEFEAKLFGGGYMFSDPAGTISWNATQLQERNIAAGRELVARYGYRVVAEHMGGHGHRKLIFDVHTGHAWLKHMPLRAKGGHDGRKAA